MPLFMANLLLSPALLPAIAQQVSISAVQSTQSPASVGTSFLPSVNMSANQDTRPDFPNANPAAHRPNPSQITDNTPEYHRPIEIYSAANLSRITYLGSGQTSSWTSLSLGLVAPIKQHSALTFEATRDHRFGLSDVQAMAQFDTTFSPKLSAHLAATLTPNTHFKAKHSVSAGADYAITRQFVGSLDARIATYGTGSFTTISPSIHFYPKKSPFELAATWINIWDPTGNHTQGYAVNATYNISETKRLLAGYANYPDTESGITRRVDSLFIAAVWPLTARLNLRITAEHEVRELTYRRNGITLSLSWRLGPRRPG
jgi:YaiO family outer membrane protein